MTKSVLASVIGSSIAPGIDIWIVILAPVAFQLPWVGRQFHNASSLLIDFLPINWMAQTIKRAQRAEHHLAFILIATEGRQHGAFLAQVTKCLLNGPKQDRMRAHLDEDVVAAL